MLSRRLFPLLCLTGSALFIWCFATHRWSLEAWKTPMQLHGDPLEIYTRVQAAAEDLAQPLLGYARLPRLAAPFGADWSRYPVSDRVVFTLLGWLARGVGVFAAVNLAMAAVHVLDALVFYLCARFLRWRWEWAFATALLFSFSSFNFRWSVTVSFSLSFFIPPLLLLCGWIGRPAPAVRARAWTWLAAVLGGWLGGANPYFGYFAAQLVGFAVLLQLIRRREFARWRAGAVLLGAFVVSFLLHNAAYFLAPTDGASRLTLARNYRGSEIYALKLADLVIPPAEHAVSALGKIGRAYEAQSALRGEFFINYLGVAGLVGFGLLIWSALRVLLQRRKEPIPDAALGAAWTIMFSAVGGVNSLLALAGLDVFRASNRNSIFLLVWALWFFGRWCQRHWRPASPLLRFALPLAVAVFGVADSLPRLPAARLLRLNAAELHAQRATMRSLEQRLGRAATVFQVPTPPFPETGKVVELGDYEQFLPYLLSDTLRFSYGALRGTPLSRGLRALARLPAPIMTDELEATGFNAVWVDRRGLAKHGDWLVAGFRSLGLEEFPQTAFPHVVIFILKPSPHPRRLDLSDPQLFEPWDVINFLSRPKLVVLDGWYDLERNESRTWRWAQNLATTGIAMPAAGTVELSFWAHSLRPGDLVLEVDGHEVWRHLTTPQSLDQRIVPLKLAAGRHRLVWHFTGELERPASGDTRQLGFAVENLELSLLPAVTDAPQKR